MFTPSPPPTQSKSKLDQLDLIIIGIISATQTWPCCCIAVALMYSRIGRVVNSRQEFYLKLLKTKASTYYTIFFTYSTSYFLCEVYFPTQKYCKWSRLKFFFRVKCSFVRSRSGSRIFLAEGDLDPVGGSPFHIWIQSAARFSSNWIQSHKRKNLIQKFKKNSWLTFFTESLICSLFRISLFNDRMK